MATIKYQHGALILKSSSNILTSIKQAANIVSGTLYLPVPLLPTHLRESPKFQDNTNSNVNLNTRIETALSHAKFLTTILGICVTYCPKLEIRFILPNLNNKITIPLYLSKPIKIIVSEFADKPSTQTSPSFSLLANRLPNACENFQFLTPIESNTINDFSLKDTHFNGCYSHVVTGGTFDHMHQGHWLLLVVTALFATESVLAGISSVQLLKNKILYELLEPLQLRIQNVKNILNDMKPGLTLNLPAIIDVYGPTITQQNLQCLIVSQETIKGGEEINLKRSEKKFAPLEIFTIDLIHGMNEKLSSTQKRIDLLGEYIDRSDCHQSKSIFLPGLYIIGLTGVTCSGKSTIASYLKDFGAYVIDCDKLGHEAYKIGSEAYSKVVSTFGDEILEKNGEINRKALGQLVFSDKNRLIELNNIVWPAIGLLTKNELEIAKNKGFKICILDAAVLLEANWDSFVHEVWVSFVSKSESIKRLIERNQISEELATKRVESQMSSEDKISQANVVFHSKWDYETTKVQVKKAWDLLQERIAFNNFDCKI